MSDPVSLPDMVDVPVFTVDAVNPKKLAFRLHPDTACSCDSCKSVRNSIAVLYFQGLLALPDETRLYAQRGAFEHFDL